MPDQTASSLVKVFIVEDHQMFKEWLGHLISVDKGFVICGEADNARDALVAIEEAKPDIAIVDLTLKSGTSGLELIKDLKAMGTPVPVLALSMHDEELYAERVILAGGKGYVSKSAASATLMKAIRQVLNGDLYLSEGITASILDRMSTQKMPTPSRGLSSLAQREFEIFQLIGQGYNAREIAEKLHLGETTVSTYRIRIKEKLQLRNGADLNCLAVLWLRDGEKFMRERSNS